MKNNSFQKIHLPQKDKLNIFKKIMKVQELIIRMKEKKEI
jgi:hypothetical protein